MMIIIIINCVILMHTHMVLCLLLLLILFYSTYTCLYACVYILVSFCEALGWKTCFLSTQSFEATFLIDI